MKKRFRKGRKFILYGLSVLLLCMGIGINADAMTGDQHPDAEISPDGNGWTIVNELPEEDYSADYASFWAERFTEMEVGEPDLVSDELGEGEHIYKYKRTGVIPIWKWYVNHEPAECIHQDPIDTDYLGFELDLSIRRCYLNYWSGWIPVCANCGEELVSILHYIKPSSLQSINEYNVDKCYYYFCPHNGHLEQGVSETFHMCDAISANQYRVVYKKNAGSAKGEMMDSYHMYCNATHHNGEVVVPQTTLNKNNYTYAGYTFKGWALTPDGEAVFEDQAEIYNLTDENYDKEKGTGTVYLYAVWERSLSTLIVDANGGVYDDEIGVWDDTTKRRTYADINYGTPLTLKEENLTPPDGYRVVFEPNGGSHVDEMKTRKKFVSWKMGTPFGGQFRDNVYKFIGPDGTVDVITAQYANGSITLPNTTREGWTFGGWYSDSNFIHFIGFAGDTYTPSSNTILYAKWTELVLYAEPKTDESLAGGKGYAFLLETRK